MAVNAVLHIATSAIDPLIGSGPATEAPTLNDVNDATTLEVVSAVPGIPFKYAVLLVAEVNTPTAWFHVFAVKLVADEVPLLPTLSVLSTLIFPDARSLIANR